LNRRESEVNDKLSNPTAQIDKPEFIDLDGVPQGQGLAYRRRPAHSDGASLVWLGGFRSDMLSTKAQALDDFAAQTGRAFLRFDYSGHGESAGVFEHGTIGAWMQQSVAMIRALTSGPQILIGSSMGGWIALLVARVLAELGELDRLRAMVLIAPAVDFTEKLIWQQLSPALRAEIDETGQWLRPSAYGPPFPITRTLIEEGRNHLLLDNSIRSYCPIHIVQGMADPDVPWQYMFRLVDQLAGDPLTITLIRDGDHRLSQPEHIARLIAAVRDIDSLALAPRSP
jgi:pimeloyl-ACP methyl ester carboxylesterase